MSRTTLRITLRFALRFALGLTGLMIACTDAGSGDDSGTSAETSTSSSSSDGSDSSDSSGESGTVPQSGEELFATFCASCHGPAAEGSTLAYEIRHPSHEYARWVIRNGRSGGEFPGSEMAAYPEALLDDAAVDAILDWLDGFEQPTTGEALYLDYCGNCHGADARGGVVEKPIEYEGVNDMLEKVREGEGGSNYGARLQYMPSVASDRLDNDEVTAIAEHIATL